MQRDQRDDDAAWQAIVDNYGEPVLDDEPPPPEPAPAPAPVVLPPTPRDEDPPELRPDPDDRFVPPVPPPLPRPTLDRLLAWLGVFGAPAVLLVVVVTGLELPGLLGWFLVGSFLVGFGYLVLTMPTSRDPGDDGARL